MASPPRGSLPGAPVPLPHRGLLEQVFGRPLSDIPVRAGGTLPGVLDGAGAVAATQGNTVFLRHANAPPAVVAHEVTHALQPWRGYGPATEVEPRGSTAEAQAEHVAAAVLTRSSAREVRGTLAGRAGNVALLRGSDMDDASELLPGLDETPEERLRRQATEIERSLSIIVGEAQAVGYSRIVITVENTGNELIPGFEKQGKGPSAAPTRNRSMFERELSYCLAYILARPPGLHEIVFGATPGATFEFISFSVRAWGTEC